MKLSLRFPTDEVLGLAASYSYGGPDESTVIALQGPVRAQGFLTLDQLRVVARWKAPRSGGKLLDDDAYVREVTACSLSTSSERLRIEVLTLLPGVGWPMASVILHWYHPDPYPILDFRALWSVGVPPYQRHDFTLWHCYTEFCREASCAADVDMRTLDRALWQYSKENQ